MSQDRGFALLMVLWTLMLLAFLATVFGSNAQTEIYLARNLVENAQAEALADGGVFRAAAGLAKPPSEGGYRGNGQVYIWESPAGEVRFSIRDEGGKVDLNQADEVLLRELFVVVGLDPKQSAELADAIIDFRDEDGDKQPHGAESRDYSAARLPYGAKNKPFVLVDELIYVLGMTPEIYRKVAPLVSVYGQQEMPHEYTAPPEVLRAMDAAVKASRRGGRGRESAGGIGRSQGGGGFGRESVPGEQTGRSQQQGFSERGSTSSSFGSSSFDSDNDSAADDDDEAQDQRDRSGATVFAVHAEGRTPEGTVFTRDAIVDVSGAEDTPVAFRSWSQGQRVLFPIVSETPGQG